jgi:hypothetical protein
MRVDELARHPGLPLPGVRLLDLDFLDNALADMTGTAGPGARDLSALAEMAKLLIAVDIRICDADVLVEVGLARAAEGTSPSRRRADRAPGHVVTIVVLIELARGNAIKGV